MRRIIIGISGASGAIYGIRALEVLRRDREVETHLVLSPSGKRTILEETRYSLADVQALAAVVHEHRDIGASIASGSFETAGMLVAPCSVKTLSGIAHCYSENLLTRAADVCLKERRPLVLMVRETPLHMGHLRTMANVSEMGAIVMPPVPAFYHKPKTIDDIVNQTVGRALDLFGFDFGIVKRWGEDPGEESEERPVRRFRKG
jgi:4-hydroxy-3-polyprenylbenzoate decarboxylase